MTNMSVKKGFLSWMTTDGQMRLGEFTVHQEQLRTRKNQEILVLFVLTHKRLYPILPSPSGRYAVFNTGTLSIERASVNRGGVSLPGNARFQYRRKKIPNR